MRNKLISILVSFMMVVGFLPAMSIAASADNQTVTRGSLSSSASDDEDCDIAVTPTTSHPIYDYTESLEPGDSITIKVNNASSSNSYTFALSSVVSSVADVSASSIKVSRLASGTFSVTAIKDGDTAIKITNNNYNLSGSDKSRKATINLVVGKGSSKDTPEDSPATTLAFVSDVHSDSASASSDSAVLIDRWLKKTSSAVDDIFDVLGSCGDLGPQSGDGSNYWSCVKPVFDAMSDNSSVIKNSFIVAGNHEQRQGEFKTYYPTNQYAKQYRLPGESVKTSEYILYSLGAEAYEEDYPASDISDLSDFLKENKSFDGPIFVIGHFPLHCYNGNSGESTEIHDGKAAVGSANVVEVLNNYPNVVFIWGHNHSRAPSKDTNYDKIYTAGDTISGQSGTISFTYLSAGCMRASQFGIDGRGLVAGISDSDNDGKKECELEYYSECGTATGIKKTLEFDGEETEKETVNISLTEGEKKTIRFDNVNIKADTDTSMTESDIAKVSVNDVNKEGSGDCCINFQALILQDRYLCNRI